MSITECADKEIEQCYYRGCRRNALDQRVLIDSCSWRCAIGAAKSEQGSMQQNIDCVIEAAVYKVSVYKASDTDNILECNYM
jgi:hypothetical protein